MYSLTTGKWSRWHCTSCSYSRPREAQENDYVQAAREAHQAYLKAAKGIEKKSPLGKALTNLAEPEGAKLKQAEERRNEEDEEAAQGGKIIITIEGDDKLHFTCDMKVLRNISFWGMLRAYVKQMAKSFGKPLTNVPIILMHNGRRIQPHNDTPENLGLKHRDVVEAFEGDDKGIQGGASRGSKEWDNEKEPWRW